MACVALSSVCHLAEDLRLFYLPKGQPGGTVLNAAADFQGNISQLEDAILLYARLSLLLHNDLTPLDLQEHWIQADDDHAYHTVCNVDYQFQPSWGMLSSKTATPGVTLIIDTSNQRLDTAQSGYSWNG